MFGLSHLYLPVSDLDRSRAFYVKAMGFEVLSTDAWIPAQGDAPEALILDARGAQLCLVIAGAELQPQELAFQTVRIRTAIERLVRAGATLEEAPRKTRSQTFEAILRDPDGHRLRLWRRLREDEYEDEPELPTTGPWDEDARALLKSFVRQTPVLFRDIARSGCVREAEFLTPVGDPVDRNTVIRAVIRATPRLLRPRLRQPLADHGFDPEDFAEDFSI